MSPEDGDSRRELVEEEGGGVYIFYIYTTLHCHHQHDTCIKMGSDESQAE